MNKEFPIGIWTKIFNTILGLFILGFGVFLLTIKGPYFNPAILLLPGSILFCSVWLLIHTFKSKVIITENNITKINSFNSETLVFNQIKGCRIEQSSIVVEPISTDYKRLVINNYYSYIDSDEFKLFLEKNFPDQNVADLKNEHEKLLQNTRLGATAEDRIAAQKKAKLIANIYSVAGLLVCFIGAIINVSVSSFLFLLYPLIGIFIMLTSKGLTKFISNSETSVYSSVILGFSFPCIAMLIYSLFKYDLLDYGKLSIISLIISTLIFILLYRIGINKVVATIYGQIIVMIISSLLYGFGTVRLANCGFDRSDPMIFHTPIIKKWINSGKGTDYYLRLKPWKSGLSYEDISVPHSKYDNNSIGDTVTVYEKNGALGIHWIYIETQY